MKMSGISKAQLLIDVTGVFGTSGSEREFTLEGSWYADEETQAALILTLILFSMVLIGVLLRRPGVTFTRGGKMMAFLGLFALPLLCFGMGFSLELEHSKTTSFCLSCHSMESYGKSLRVDDF